MSLVYDKKTFQEQKDNLIMYIMNHGFVEVPEGIKELTGKEQGSISTFHDTVFINNLIPGSYQTTSTGPGHFQATNLDVKYITQGKGIQFNVRYNAQGRIQEVLAQYLEPGCWAFALPGYVDYMVNLEGLRFNDFSINLTPEQAAEISPRFNFAYSDSIAKAIKDNAKCAPYSAIKLNNEYYLVKHPVYTPQVVWIQTPKSLLGKKTLLSLYNSLNKDSIEKIVFAIIKKTQQSANPPAELIKLLKEQFEAIEGLKGKPIATKPAKKLYAWGGVANQIVLGEEIDPDNPIAELWFNSTQKDGLSYMPVDIALNNIKLNLYITLEEFLEYHPQALGMHPAKLFFTKFLCTRFEDKVHMGFNSKIQAAKATEEFIKLLKEDRRLAWRLKYAIIDTKEAFDRFKRDYEEWTTEQAKKQWQAVNHPIKTKGWLKEGEDVKSILEEIRAVRAEIVSFLNEIKLVPGQVIISPVGYPHAIFGLSHQTHPLKGTEAKNEAWIIITVKNPQTNKDELILVEPQQTSNTTYSFADFYTPIEYKDGAVNMRKNLNKNKDARTNEEILQGEYDTIEGFVKGGLKSEGTLADDFILQPRIMSKSNNTTEEALIEGIHKDLWPQEYFRVHKITLYGRKDTLASFRVSPISGISHELLLIKGSLTLKIPGQDNITLGFGKGSYQSVFIPADFKQNYTISSDTHTEVLKLFKPLSGIEDEIANIIKQLSDRDVPARLNNTDLVSFINSPSELLTHIQSYSILKEPEQIKQVLLAKLKSVKNPNAPPGLLSDIVYPAIFDQDSFLRQQQKPLNIVIFRGGRGASDFTQILRQLPNVNVYIVLGATDDGRSWRIASQDFDATGVPDAGKSLLDLAGDIAAKGLLSSRIKIVIEEKDKAKEKQLEEEIRALLDIKVYELHKEAITISEMKTKN